MELPRVHATAIVEDGVEIGAGTAVWDNAHLRTGARIGAGCIIGEKSYVGPGAIVGDRVKINAFVYICTGVSIEEGVMVSAGVVFTNDPYPRATTPDLASLSPSAGGAVATRVCRGATIGAGSVIGSGLTIGRFAMVGMGSVVTRPVPEFHLVMGQPARSTGCVCRCGRPIRRFPLEGPSRAGCDACGRQYELTGMSVIEVSQAAHPGP